MFSDLFCGDCACSKYWKYYTKYEKHAHGPQRQASTFYTQISMCFWLLIQQATPVHTHILTQGYMQHRFKDKCIIKIFCIWDKRSKISNLDAWHLQEKDSKSHPNSKKPLDNKLPILTKCLFQIMPQSCTNPFSLKELQQQKRDRKKLKAKQKRSIYSETLFVLRQLMIHSLEKEKKTMVKLL